MKIKQGIRRTYPKTAILIESSPDIYVADMRLRSSNTRGVEVSSAPLLSPDGKGRMDCVHFSNHDLLSIDFAIFDDNQFKRRDGKNDKHCEGCIYPTFTDPLSWVAFLEVKDCRPGLASKYKKYAIRQVFQSVKAFCSHNILDKERIYGIIAFPRKHTEFNDTLFADLIEVRRLRHFTHIMFYGTNEILILDDLRISMPI